MLPISVDLPWLRFREMIKALGVPDQRLPLAQQAFDVLRAHYAEPHRAYHNADHIRACLRLLDDPAHTALAEYPLEVECALWFHDAVYDTHAQDNEAQSAAWLETVLAELGVGSEAIARIASSIRATQHHQAETADAQLVLDIDLSILGADEVTYQAFESGIRQEYAWVPVEIYGTTRTGVLQRFLARDRIYQTPTLRERFEIRARTNLQRAIAELARVSARRS
jgi:predicted metal-dependent HD superfamily phosphohydrolase